MSTGADIVSLPVPGLCGSCSFARLVRARRGSIYRLCRRSEADEGYPRYPHLPVTTCPGFVEGAPDG